LSSLRIETKSQDFGDSVVSDNPNFCKFGYENLITFSRGEFLGFLFSL